MPKTFSTLTTSAIAPIGRIRILLGMLAGAYLSAQFMACDPQSRPESTPKIELNPREAADSDKNDISKFSLVRGAQQLRAMENKLQQHAKHLGLAPEGSGYVVHSAPDKISLHIDGAGETRFEEQRAEVKHVAQEPGIRVGMHPKSKSDAEKARLLRETSEVRDALRVRATHEKGKKLASRWIEELKIEVALQNDQAKQLKREIFELWDDCDTTPSESEDPLAQDLARHSAKACAELRRGLEELVREKLPQNSPLGYTDEELKTFNAKRASNAAFRPYEVQGQDALKPPQ